MKHYHTEWYGYFSLFDRGFVWSQKTLGIRYEQNELLDFVHFWLTWQEKSPQPCTRSFKRFVEGGWLII